MKTILCLALVLSGLPVISRGDAEPRPLPALHVVIIPSTTNIRIREPFHLALRVENPTSTNQTIRVMNCSWEQEWQPSNPKIPWGAKPCPKNFEVNVEIPPGGAYSNAAPMYIYDLISDKELSFRMGFTSIGSTNTFWSNEVKLHVLPPDAWRHGEKYYRDRNHDGKIDWEISGRTWMGHAVHPLEFIYVTSNGTTYAHQEITGQGVDTIKVDTNYAGFYNLEYGVGGTNNQIQWTKNIHERVPVVGKDFEPVEKESWMDLDYWMPK